MSYEESFPAYVEEMERFRNSKLYKEKYLYFISHLEYSLKTYDDPYMPSHELESRVGVTSTQVRDLVKFARRSGVPIVSNQSGYKIAETAEELKATIDHLESRTHSILFTTSKLNSVLSRMLCEGVE